MPTPKPILTYRQELQSIISEMQRTYDRLQYLRDQSAGKQKDSINLALQLQSRAWEPLQFLDDKQLPQAHADMKIFNERRTA